MTWTSIVRKMTRRDDQAGSIRWYCYDGLGSVLAEVDPSGNLTASRSYDVYGGVRGGQGGTSKHKFVGALGHPSEDETGLIYMRARYMDPQTGRFVSEDPKWQGSNWFVYANSRSTGSVDPDGRESLEAAFGSILVWLGFSIILAANSIGGIQAAYAELTTAALGFKTLWEWTKFGIGLNIGIGGWNPINVARSIINAALSALQVAAEESLIVAMAPGCQRLAATMFGATTMEIGLLLWIDGS